MNSGVINSRSPNAFLLSAILHGAVVALLLLLTYVLQEREPEAPKIFELVAGAGDNYGATEAPALGSPTGVKVDFPEIPVVTPAPMPTPPVPEPPEPSPIAPTPPQPVPPTPPKPVAPAPTPVKTAEVAKPKPVEPKPVDMAKMVTRITEKRAANIKKKIEKDQKAAEERAAKEAALNAKRMTKEEFDRQNRGPVKVSKIDAEGIAGGVVGGSTKNKTGGAGGKALTREQMDLSDAYISILIQRLHDAHQKPDGLSDLLQTRVSFRLNDDGSISDVRIVRSSGNNDYDNSVLAAFRKVRLPTPPANLKTDTYIVTFKMKEDE